MTIVHYTLVSAKTRDGSYCSVNKTPAVLECRSLLFDAKCLCSVHVHAIVANNSVWKIQNFAQFVYIVFVKPELRLTLVVCHQVQIESFVAPIWNIRIFRRINVIQKQVSTSSVSYFWHDIISKNSVRTQQSSQVDKHTDSQRLEVLKFFREVNFWRERRRQPMNSIQSLNVAVAVAVVVS